MVMGAMSFFLLLPVGQNQLLCSVDVVVLAPRCQCCDLPSLRRLVAFGEDIKAWFLYCKFTFSYEGHSRIHHPLVQMRRQCEEHRVMVSSVDLFG